MLLGKSCRDRFTEADLQFMARCWGHSTKGEEAALFSLLSDPEERDRLLDEENVLRRLLEEAVLVTLSANFYFYVLVRHIFLRHGLASRNLADYVGRTLVEFTRTGHQHRTHRGDKVGEGRVIYLLDWIGRLQDTSEPRERLLLQVQIGDLALFLSGMLTAHLEYRRDRRAAPSLAYFQSIGVNSYRQAESHPLVRQGSGETLFGELAETFMPITRALREMTAQLFSDR